MKKRLFLWLTGLIILCCFQASFAQNNCEAPYDSLFQRHLFIISEQKPEYPGGFSQLRKHLLKHLKITQKGLRAGPFSRLTFFLLIEKNGKVSQVKIFDYQNKDLVKAGMVTINTLLKKMARFKPGKCGNKPVTYKITLPMYIRWG
ncbi:hypothetical protein BKI52_03690 [marine bacterium AO1-C]|nr:hypothetical protein BKI52_03690 [marine bacterium AO1-C]